MRTKLLILTTVFLLATNVYAATRVFYEDFEDTNYSTWFAERSMGTSDSGFWSELTSEVTRSTLDPVSGSYCMTYDPWTGGNPHINIGYNTTYGNTSNFDISDTTTDILYFRWRHKWEANADYSGSAHNKNFILGMENGGVIIHFATKIATDIPTKQHHS